MTDFIVFGEDWGALPSSTQHLIRHLLPRHRVIWVNSIGLRSPKPDLRDAKRLFKKALSLISHISHQLKTQQRSDEPYIVEPFAIPFHQFKIIRKLNRFLLSNQVRKVADRLGFDQVTLWLSLPTAVDMIGCFQEASVIYYCGDDFDSLDSVDHQLATQLEKALVNKADLIVSASQKISKKFPKHKTVWLPHGVDYQLFSSPTGIPDDNPTSGPVAGFYGSISSWVDTQLLSTTAKAMPEWQFVLVGHTKVDISPLKSLPNIHFLGFKPHHELPSYVQHWDVALLPFQSNPQIEACCPLKLREYLASGTPVAATQFPAAEEFKDFIAIQSPGESFANVINRAYAQQSKVTDRRLQVSEETWQARAAQLEALMGQQLLHLK